MQFGILGALEVRDGEHQLPLRSIKQRSLLAMLLCHRGTVVGSDVLVDALWGAGAGDTGTRRLRLQIHRLRQILGAGVPITHESTGYLMRLPDDAVDAWRFEVLVRLGRQALGSKNVAGGSDLLRSALGVWRGPALSGLDDIPLLQLHATRLEEERLAALADRIDADLRLYRHADLIGELSVLVREHPLRERLRGQLMIALYATGRQAEALEVYRDGRRILSTELGLEPSPELRRLQVAILSSDPALVAALPSVHARTRHGRCHHRHDRRAGCPVCARRSGTDHRLTG
ncbi:AfsR/SARP family transcriptional regulator [Nonomuraea sp. NPDC048916]|uniref:AfsR/SARP family transcriptional regulator n=1 Tax=Nonomuraea sp. NPDC048916 TaxID=3154232 RepID=UPI0033F942DE